MILKYFSILVSLSMAAAVVSKANAQSETEPSELSAAEDSLAYYLDSIRTTQIEKNKYYWNNKFREKLESTLKLKDAYDYPFSKLKSIGSLKSPDNYFRIFNWNIENLDFTQNYFGYILIPSNHKHKVIELSDRSAAIEKPESQQLDNKRWYGCLYYKIIPSGAGNKKEYTLLGFDMNNRSTKKRIIEVLSFSGDKANFGAGIFDYNDKTFRKRVVFEYSAEVQMTLLYEAEKNRIVFDHLSPNNKDAEGLYEFYFPDGSYCSLTLNNGRWTYEDDSDVRGKKDKNDKNFHDPSKDQIDLKTKKN